MPKSATWKGQWDFIHESPFGVSLQRTGSAVNGVASQRGNTAWFTTLTAPGTTG